MTAPLMNRLRYFLKDHIRQETDFSMTDQSRGTAPPPIEKPCPEDAELISLPGTEDFAHLPMLSVLDAVKKRISHRQFSPEPLSIVELAYLVWATQGVRESNDERVFRTVPSAGCRHALETYLAVFRVTGLSNGLYRYLPSTHQLLKISEQGQLSQNLSQAALGQQFVGSSAVTFLWTAIPYRMEWRYGEASHKVIALDAGHVCQNLYLACESIGAGTCAIAAYNQSLADRLIDVDGENEFVIYMAPVGKQ